MLVVTKFGGSSVSSATQFAKIKNIVQSNPLRKIVVVSALGKRDKNDTKITDLLYILHAHLKYKVDYSEIWDTLYTRYTGIKNDLGIDYDIEADLNELKSQLNSSTSEAYIVSRGEYLTAKLMAAYLGFKFIDAKDNLIFNFDGSLKEDLTAENLNKNFDANGVVIPGFYGAYPNGSIKLLSRGGSDVTGSIVAKSLNASLYENWTDVSGVMMADPRIVKNPKIVSEITYHELRELSFMGANVLHEETIFPVQKLNIPINLKNTNEPDAPGTIIKESASKDHLVTGIAGKKGFTAFTIYKTHLSTEVGFMRRLLSVFEKLGISIEHTPTGIDIVSVIVANDQLGTMTNKVISEIKEQINPEQIDVKDDIALIAIVGRNMKNHLGLSGMVFKALSDAQININVIVQGPEELNIVVGVSNSDYEKTIQVLYQAVEGEN